MTSVGPVDPRTIKGYVRLRKRTALKELMDFDSSDQEQLIDVMRELALPSRDNDPDEGSWTPPRRSWIQYERKHLVYHYRRGLTKQKRAELDEAERQGIDLDDREAGRNLWGVLHYLPSNHCRRMYPLHGSARNHG